MLGLAILMVTLLAFPLWCMAGSSGVGATDRDAPDARDDIGL